MMPHELELRLINFIQQFRNPLLDAFFKFLDFFDRQEFYFILLPIVWLIWGWKSGLRLFYILLLNNLFNHGIKELCLLPRPFHLDPNVGIIQVSGLGFPSGAAQTVILLSGILFRCWKSSWKWLLISTYILFVSFSRVYLGIHFPTDIVGGWLIGFVLWAMYTYVGPLLEKRLENLNLFSLFLLSQVVPMLLLITWKFCMPAMRICGVAIGIGMGLFVLHYYRLLLPPPRNRNERILRGMVGVLGTFVCYLFTSLLPTYRSIVYLLLQFVLLGLWLSLGSALACRKF